MDVASKIALLRHIREHVSGPEKANEGFSLKSPEKEKVASPLVQLFKADQPSALQKEQACLSMLNEARRAVENLHLQLSSLTSSAVENYRNDPQSMERLTDSIDEASAKLDTIREQCGDVLPAGAMEELGELEKKLNDVREMLFDNSRPAEDFLEIAGRMLQAVGEGLSTVAAGVAIMLRLIFGPGQPQTNGGGGLLVAQNENSEGTEPHRGSGRFGDTSHRGSGRFEA